MLFIFILHVITSDIQGPLPCLYLWLQCVYLLLPYAIFIFVTGIHEDLIISPLIFQKEKCWFIELAVEKEEEYDQSDVIG